MKAGDEKFLPARDQGPVRRFIRDWVDSRISVAEFLLPLLLVILLMSSVGSTTLQSWSSGVLGGHDPAAAGGHDVDPLPPPP